jgi:hypothetical protein
MDSARSAKNVWEGLVPQVVLEIGLIQWINVEVIIANTHRSANVRGAMPVTNLKFPFRHVVEQSRLELT